MSKSCATEFVTKDLCVSCGRALCFAHAGEIKSLRAKLDIAVMALEKIGEPDDVNCNFNVPQDEANYYIETAANALAAITERPK